MAGDVLHWLGFEAAVNKLETAVKSHLRLGNSGLVFNDFVELQELFGVGGWPSIFFDRDRDVVDDDEVAAEFDFLEAFKVFNEDDDGSCRWFCRS
ncbi:hypothetical protein ACLOJK_029333 [Asimina triloba]